MKVGIVCYPSLGGSGVVATELGHELAAHGHEVHFISYEPPFRLKIDNHNIFFHEVEINRYDLFKYPDYALPLAVKIACVAEEYKLDILHVHYAIPHATSAYLAKQLMREANPAIITTLHGTDITLVGNDPAYFEIVKFSIERSCGVTTVSENLRQQTIQEFQISRPIEVISNFFTPKPSLLGKKPLRQKFVKEDEKLILHSSNFRPVKRPEDVVKVFLEVRKKVASKLLFLGTGEGIEGVRRLVKEHRIENDVYFLGKRGEIDAFVASADLFLLPSSQESFGLAGLEAMAYGVPVISTHVGGLPEVIEHEVSGFLCTPEDIGQMAAYATRLLTDPQLYETISRNGAKRAAENFSSSKVYPQYVAFYKKVLGTGTQGTQAT